jgi:hypothetical protein
MLLTRFLKRRFPNVPGWLIGGLSLVIVLWLVVLPIEIFNIVIKREYYYPDNNLGWIARFLYIKGYATAMSLMPSLRHVIRTDQLLAVVVVLIGLLISSSGYFMMGALLTTRRVITRITGILFVVINVALSLYVIVGLAFLLSG